MSLKHSLAQIRAAIDEAFAPVRLSIRRDAGGVTSLQVLSARFADAPDRLALLTRTLEEHGLALPPQTLTTLLAPDDHPDAITLDDLFATSRSVPTWSDALRLEPGLDREPPPEIGAPVAVFWGVKGGVGRTTALAHVARLLDRGGVRVVAVDLDLDAPSLVATWAGFDEPGGDRPRFEALIEAARAADDDTLAALVRRALRPAPRVADGVELLGPERADEDFVHALLGRLTPRALYRGRRPVLHRLIAEVVRQTQAELVLLDARSGYCEESAIAVLDLADHVALFASASPSTYGALEAAWLAVERSHIARARPRQVHLVLGMQPANAELRAIAEEEALAIAEAARARVAEELAVPLDALLPNVEPISIDYEPRVVENDGQAVDGVSGYVQLAERLRSHVRPPVASADAEWFDDVLAEADIPAPQSEDEGDSQVLARLFTRPSDLKRIARPELPLVLGAKGSGKTYIRRICLEHPQLGRALFARALPAPIFVDAFSLRGGPRPAPPVTGDMMKVLDRQAGVGEVDWSSLWSAIALVRLVTAAPDVVDPGALPVAAALDTVGGAATSRGRADALAALAAAPLELDDAWHLIDRALAGAKRSVVLFFDDLDVALGVDASAVERRNPLITGLFDRLEKTWAGLDRVAVKILLRQDLLNRVGLEEAAKYANRSVRLDWGDDDIWRLVVRSMAHASPTFAERLGAARIDVDRLEEMGPEGWRDPLEWLWGDRMGQSDADTRSRVWVSKRLSDGQGRLFPRAAMWLLEAAVRHESTQGGGGKRAAILSPKALRAAMPEVASNRLKELESEATRDEWDQVMRLRGLDSYGNRADFVEHLRDQGASEPTRALDLLNDLGVVEFGERRNRTPTVRIVDLYALAPELEIKRVGRR